MDPGPRKRGRPKLVLTKEMVKERKMLKHLRTNARRNPQVESNSNIHYSGSTGAESSDAGSASGQGIRKDSGKYRQGSNLKRREFVENNSVLDVGRQDQAWGFCEAQVWAAESIGKYVGNGPKGYTIWKRESAATITA